VQQVFERKEGKEELQDFQVVGGLEEEQALLESQGEVAGEGGRQADLH
jgi:hypothetical protein